MIKEPEHGYAPNQIEEEEHKTGYFARQASSEFAQIVERERYTQRKGKLLYLRALGRKERLILALKYGNRWQDMI